MKKHLLALAVASIVSSALYAQDIAASKVPASVQNVIKEKYPAARDVDWEKRSNNYEAEVKLGNNNEIKLLIDANGKVLMQKTEITAQDLPAAVTNAVQSHYKDYRIDDVHKIEKGGTVYYQVELDHTLKPDLKRVFTADGKEEKKLAYWK